MYFWFFFVKQKTAYDMRISDWSSDVCSSDLAMNLRISASTWAGGDADLAWAWTYSPTMVESRAETMLSCFGVTKILVTHMPQTRAARTMRPTSIYRDRKNVV